MNAGPTTDFQPDPSEVELRIFDPAAAAELKGVVADLKAKGVTQDQLRAAFAEDDIALSVYSAALRGEPVSSTACHRLVALSFDGILEARLATYGWRPVDRAAIASFADAVLRYATPGVMFSLRVFEEGQSNAWVRAHRFGDLAGLVSEAAVMAQDAAGHPTATVFCPPIAGFAAPEERRAREQDAVEAYAVRVDCDKNPNAARKRLEGVLGPATVVVESGGEWIDPKTGEVQPKAHLYWRTTEPATGAALARLKEACRLAARLVDGDPTAASVVHPMRWPGSWHRKGDPKLATIASLNPEVEVELGDALERLEEAVGDDPAAEAGGRDKASGAAADVAELVSNILAGRSLHDSITRLAAKWVGSGMYPGAAVSALRALMEQTAQRDYRWHRRFDYIPRAVSTAEAKFGKAEPEPEADAPEPKAGATPPFDPWATHATPAFPMDTLPSVVRRFVEHAARNIGVDPSALAMTALAALSGAADHRFRLKLMNHGDWYSHPRLWVMLVGDPSAKKTPAINACLKPIRAVERDRQSQYKRDLARHSERKEAGEKEPAPPSPVRQIVNDTTIEKLGEVLAQQDRGLLVEHDEISGWIGSMDKYGGAKGAAADRAFWLTAYNGGPKAIDRIGRGSSFIENCSVSFIGGIQPKRLAELGALTSDGLLQRFLPVMMVRPNYPEDADDHGAAAAYGLLINQILNLQPVSLRMSAEATQVADELQRFLFDVEQVDGLGDSFRAFIGKLAGVHGSLMLVLHLASDPENAPYDEVSAQVATAAARIVREFLIPHAQPLYQQSTDKVDWDYMRVTASFVLTSPKARFTTSDFTSGVWALRGLTVWELAKKVSPLVAGGWLTEEPGAAPAKAWVVVPGIREQLTERRETELAHKAEVVKTLRALNRSDPA